MPPGQPCEEVEASNVGEQLVLQDFSRDVNAGEHGGNGVGILSMEIAWGSSACQVFLLGRPHQMMTTKCKSDLTESSFPS
jgi:hypothetical protein